MMCALNNLPPSIAYNVGKPEEINRSRSEEVKLDLDSKYKQEFVELDLLGNI